MPRDAVDWIGLLTIAVALHGFSNGFAPIFPAISLPCPCSRRAMFLR